MVTPANKASQPSNVRPVPFQSQRKKRAVFPEMQQVRSASLFELTDKKIHHLQEGAASLVAVSAQSAAVILSGSMMSKAISGSIDEILKEVGSVSVLIKISDKAGLSSKGITENRQIAKGLTELAPLVKIGGVAFSVLGSYAVLYKSNFMEKGGLEHLAADVGRLSGFVYIGERVTQFASNLSSSNPSIETIKTENFFTTRFGALLETAMQQASTLSYSAAAFEVGRALNCLHSGEINPFWTRIGSSLQLAAFGDKLDPNSKSSENSSFAKMAARIGGGALYLGGAVGFGAIAYKVYSGDLSQLAEISLQVGRVSSILSFGDRLLALGSNQLQGNVTSSSNDQQHYLPFTKKMTSVANTILHSVSQGAALGGKIAYAAASLGALETVLQVGSHLWAGNYTEAAAAAVNTASLPVFAVGIGFMAADRLSQLSSFLKG